MKMKYIEYIAGFGGAAALLISILMMFVTKAYLNKSKRRGRLIELIWGRNNEWYKGKKFDFVMANYIIPSSTFGAWVLKMGWGTKKFRENGPYAFPYLRFNDNYLKLLEEFTFFVWWERIKVSLIIFFGLSASVIYGLKEGWW